MPVWCQIVCVKEANCQAQSSIQPAWGVWEAESDNAVWGRGKPEEESLGPVRKCVGAWVCTWGGRQVWKPLSLQAVF